MKNCNVIGIDLAKNIIQVCIINKHGEVRSNKAMSPLKLKEFLTKSSPSIVAFEGASTCHYWGRFATNLSHDVRVIGPRKVKAFLQGQKTDANDALAIAVAATQPGMLFSQLKNEEQQVLQSLETSRRFLDKHRVSLENHIRAFLYEYGITVARGAKYLRESVLDILSEGSDELPHHLLAPLLSLWEQYRDTVKRVAAIEKELTQLVKKTDACQRLKALEGVGDVCAIKLFTSLGNGEGFKNGRQASAYIGVTPKQYSSGGKVSMKGIDKVGGNKVLRANLFMGARAVIKALPDKPRTSKEQWLIALIKRVGEKRACIALANKTVRTAWALLASGEKYKSTALVS
jgi:transposase